jgi:hypothetical protein
MLPTWWVKIWTYLQSERFLSIIIYNLLPKIANNIVTDLLKALRNSGHAAPQQDDATVLWKNLLRVGACTGDVMIYGACAGDVSSDCATVGDRFLLGGRQRTNEMPGL